MCNIVILKPGQMPVRSEFDNMCYNNWHSFGLVTKIDNKLDITKKVPDNGEIDPDEIYKLLERDVEFERILHVRHNTAGATNLENCHPFSVYFNLNDSRTIVFMHNGTMYEYKSKKQAPNGYAQVDDPDGPSDTKNFTDKILIPVVERLGGDITNRVNQLILDKFWPMSGNRGVLIASDQPILTFGDWKKRKDAEGNDFLSSNDEYFDSCKRGPEFDRREEARKKLATKTTTKTGGEGRTVVPLSEFRIGHKHGFYQLNTSLKNINSDWNIYDRDTASFLGYATKDEITEIFKAGEKECVSLMDWIFSDYTALYHEHLEALEDKKKAENIIASLKKQLANQEVIIEQKRVG